MKQKGPASCLSCLMWLVVFQKSTEMLSAVGSVLYSFRFDQHPELSYSNVSARVDKQEQISLEC